MADSKKYNGSQWEHSLRKLTTATEAVENPLYSDGTAITNYTISGNTVQNGTPTPDNPVNVNGVGELTDNLANRFSWGYYAFADGTSALDNAWVHTDKIPCKASTKYTGSSDIVEGSRWIGFVFWDSNGDYISTSNKQKSQPYPTSISLTVTTPSNAAYMAMNVAGAVPHCQIPLDTVTNFQVTESETVLPYEPYGYKIPISSGQQTIDIYIGDLPLLKSLDGTAVDEISNGTLTRRVDSDGSVLPTPTTTQITMPSIPTTDGANTISVDTTVQPSEFTATWTGWHDATVKEWDGSDWK